MAQLAAKKRDLLDALGGSKWTESVEFEPLRERIRRALATLLDRAQQAGAIRSDISAMDLLALARGLFRSDLEAKTRTRLIGVLFDGLRPLMAEPDDAGAVRRRGR